jgi:hypothetical protein
MIGHISPTVHPIHLDAALFELSIIPQQVSNLTLATKGEGVRVLKQQYGGGNLSGGDLSRKLGLRIPGLLVGHQTQTLYEA